VDISSINVVGCGRLGQAIAKLFVTNKVTEHVYVCNRSRSSGERAIAAIGAGVVCEVVEQMPQNNLWLVSCGDQEIGSVAQVLADRAAIPAQALVFHCSGILTSEVLAPVRAKGARIGSIHPIRSFADAELAVREFAGTYCAVEGDSEAVKILEILFARVGANTFSIPTEAKMLCHAGHVFASNYLVALLECSRRLYVEAGIPEGVAMQIMQPLIRGTIENIARLGNAQALTGPIARGDDVVVGQQLAHVAAQDPLLGDLYASLGRIAVELAHAQGLSSERCERMRDALGVAGKANVV
jgi:predicted short-subunit dehydrogenase-like oxidoreductase (DUF2520 family)